MRRAERELQSVSATACDPTMITAGHGYFGTGRPGRGPRLLLYANHACYSTGTYDGFTSLNNLRTTTTTAKLRVRDSAAPRARVNDQMRKSMLTTACQ